MSKNKFANAKNIFRYSIPHIYIANSPNKGRGVFAARPLKKGEPIELCPVLVLSNEDTELIIRSKLYHYYFVWGDDSSRSGLAPGFGSLYNHSYQANARYQVDYEAETLEIFAYRDIEAGEEIFINYNGEPNDPEPVWFDKKKDRDTTT